MNARIPPRRVTPTDVRQALLVPAARLRAQLAAASEATEMKVNSIDPRLKPEHARTEERKTRQAFVNAMGNSARELAALAEAMREQRAYYDAAHIRATATFDPDPVKNATLGLFWYARLERATSSELVHLARVAAAEQRLALAEAIAAEAWKRGKGDDQAAEAAALARLTPVPGAELAEELDRELAAIQGEQVAYLEASDGRRRTLDRVTAAYAAPHDDDPETAAAPPLVA